MVHGLHHIPRKNMLVRERGLDVVDRSIWHATAVENLQPLLQRLLCCFRSYQRDKGRTVGDTGFVGDEAGVKDPFGFAEECAEDAIETVIAAAEDNVTVRGGERFIRDNRSCSASVSEF